MILSFFKIAQKFISWLRLFSSWNQRNDISYTLHWTWTWRVILLNGHSLAVAIDLNLPDAFLVNLIVVSSLPNAISWSIHTEIFISSRRILILTSESQNILLWLLEFFKILLHLFDFVLIVVLMIQHATLVGFQTTDGHCFFAFVFCEVVWLVFRDDALALELELLARTHFWVEVSWLLDVFIKWHADVS
jgi:hypothetical protein